METNSLHKIIIGRSYPVIFLLFGAVVMIAGFYVFSMINFNTSAENAAVEITIGLLFGLALIYLGIILMVSTEVVEFDMINRKFRRCTSILGWKRGKWLSLDSFESLALLSSQQTNRVNSRVVNTDYKTLVYRVYLLNHNHLVKQEIYISGNQRYAEQQMRKLSELLELPITTYNPKVKRRRR